MRIGLDGIPLSERKTGVGHYTFELACSLALASPSDEFEIISPLPFLSADAERSDSDPPPNLRTICAKVNVLSKHWWTIGLPGYIKHHPLTLFHGTNYDVPLRKRCPTVLTIHDLSMLLYPDTHVTRRVRRARRRLPLMTRAATMIVTPTESVRREVCEHLHVSQSKVVAVPEAPRRSFHRLPPELTVSARRRLGIEDEFLLFVGTIEPRKNLLTLVSAFAEVLRAGPSRPQLVIVGQRGWLTNDLFASVAESGIAEHIRFTGYLSDDDLCALYSSCRAFIYPSLYEGFGLPPLEAMACGAPVIASRIPSIMEVTGTSARLVAPENTTALAQSIIDLLLNGGERQHLSSAGLRRAAEFSWERTAHLMRETYMEAIKREKLEQG